MSTDPFAYEREEERDSERFYTGPDDPDRPDPNEYEDSGLYLSKRLGCGHTVEASEDSGGMDELDRVTLADVQRLLDFKAARHRCSKPDDLYFPPSALGGGPNYAKPADSIQAQFEAFHTRHPTVLNRLVDFAYQAKRAGRSRIGIGMLFELLRWEWTIAGLPDEAEEWKLNNNYRSRYARLIMDDHPQLDGMFELRMLKTL